MPRWTAILAPLIALIMAVPDAAGGGDPAQPDSAGAETECAAQPAKQDGKADAPAPVDFGGDLCTRPKLTGNWFGAADPGSRWHHVQRRRGAVLHRCGERRLFSALPV